MSKQSLHEAFLVTMTMCFLFLFFPSSSTSMLYVLILRNFINRVLSEYILVFYLTFVPKCAQLKSGQIRVFNVHIQSKLL